MIREVRPLTPRTSNRSTPNNCNSKFTIRALRKGREPLRLTALTPASGPSQGCVAPFSRLEQCPLLSWRILIASPLLTSAFAFSATVSAQTSSVQGDVVGTDGRRLKDAEIRFEQKAGQIPPIMSRTDVKGHYTAVLPTGVYKLSVTQRGAAKAAVTVKATGANSRIDFDLRPSAEKKIRHYVWVGEETGSHLPGRWIGAGVKAAGSPTY